MVKNHLDPYFGKFLLKNITIRVVQEYINQKVKEPLSARTVNKTVTTLHTMFSYAIRQEFMADNPVRYAVRPQAGQTGVRLPQPEEIKRFLNAASPDYFAFFATAVLTGASRASLSPCAGKTSTSIGALFASNAPSTNSTVNPILRPGAGSAR